MRRCRRIPTLAGIIHADGDREEAGGPGAASAGTSREQIVDGESLEVWLKGQSQEAAVVIAGRAALRVAPLAAAATSRGDKALRLFTAVTSAIFRASALARVAAKYPTRAGELRPRAATAAALAGAAADAYDTPRCDVSVFEQRIVVEDLAPARGDNLFLR